MAQPARQYDVGILGGGPAGCATAIALARRGLRVALVRRRSRIPLTLAEVLPPCARPLLEELGVWPGLADTSPTEVRGVVAHWGADDTTGPSSHESALDRGWHIVRRRFDDLLERVELELGVEVHGAALSVSQKREKWNVPTKSTSRITQISTNFLVDATGRNAWLATRLGIGRTRINDQICLSTVENAGEPADAPDQRLLLEVVDEGWWYSA